MSVICMNKAAGYKPVILVVPAYSRGIKDKIIHDLRVAECSNGNEDSNDDDDHRYGHRARLYKDKVNGIISAVMVFFIAQDGTSAIYLFRDDQAN